MELDRRDILLLFLVAPTTEESSPPIIGTTRFEKMVWLFLNQNPLQMSMEDFGFAGAHYGPFSSLMMEDLEFLRSMGLVSIEDEDRRAVTGSIRAFSQGTEKEVPVRYELTPVGRKIASEKLAPLDPSVTRSISKIKVKYNSMPLDDLISRVYSLAPEDALSKSKIRDKYKNYTWS